jgi:hypothetical protein
VAICVWGHMCDAQQHRVCIDPRRKAWSKTGSVLLGAALWPLCADALCAHSRANCCVGEVVELTGSRLRARTVP